MFQIFLHLITGDPTIPHGASSRRSHGEQNHVGDPKRPNWCLSYWIFLLRWTSTGQAHPPHSHTGGRSSTTAQQSTSSPQAQPSSFPIFSSFQAFSTASPQAQQSWRSPESHNIALTPSWDLTIVPCLILDLQISDQASKVVGPHYRFLIKPYRSS